MNIEKAIDAIRCDKDISLSEFGSKIGSHQIFDLDGIQRLSESLGVSIFTLLLYAMSDEEVANLPTCFRNELIRFASRNITYGNYP